MKFFASLVVVMLWATCAGSAAATITLGNSQGGSSLFLSVWDNARQVSYTRNLGYTLNTFLPSGLTTLATDGSPYGTPVTGDKTPAAGSSIVFALGNTLFETPFAGSNVVRLRWDVAAYDNLSNSEAGLSRAITTALAAPQAANSGIDKHRHGRLDVPRSADLRFGYRHGRRGHRLRPRPPFLSRQRQLGKQPERRGIESAASGLTGTIDFYYLARSTEAGASPDAAKVLPYGANGLAATWSLATDGTATYTLAAVPLPASAWLFMAGLSAFAGLVRRRKAAKKTIPV